MSLERPWIVIFPGTRWDGVAGTDRQLALALAEHVEVLWVDVAFPATSLLRAGAPRRGLHLVAPGVHRLQLVGPPGSSRPGVRPVSERLVHRGVARELRARGITPMATMLMSPRASFPGDNTGAKILFVTDDWVAGAAMMGLSASWIETRLATNLARADVVAAVTPDLAEVLVRSGDGSVDPVVIPNGTNLVSGRPEVDREPLAGLVGQLNERLDLDALEAVAARDIALLVVGPRTVRDPAIGARLDSLLQRDNVDWVGEVPYAELRHHLARISVGLTPYADSPFNRSSFPLKTLEYLGAGVPVVSTDLPAARWLATDHVRVTRTPSEFAGVAEHLLEQPLDPMESAGCLQFAEAHTWAARAGQLLALVRRSV